jgi:mRNA-degrading endonuclease toxin of MazEF toxin-antitoxin module
MMAPLPVTSWAEHIYPWEAQVKVEGRLGKVMADRLRTVAKERLIKAGGRVTEPELQAIGRAIRVQLDL